MIAVPDVQGCLLGIAAGDSLGLPFEGLSSRRVAKRLKGGPLRQSLVFGYGMLSDDTEQSCLVVDAFIRSKGDPVLFQRHLARGLRSWFLAIPPGVGMATVRACLKLVVGVSPTASGVNSAGNGAAMRAPALGALLAHDLELLDTFVMASSVITHRDPRAIDGARVIAFAVALCSLQKTGLLVELSHRCKSEEWRRLLELVSSRVGTLTPVQFAREIGAEGKVSGYVLQSVPMTLFVFLTYPTEPERGLEEMIRLGGDTDTTAAMLGAIYGASMGSEAIPSTWTDRIADWPRSVTYLQRLAEAAKSGARPPKILWIASLLRNLFLLLVVLAHGFRRLVP